MAQLAERRSTNPKVFGSNPTPLQSKFSDFDYSPSPGVILNSILRVDYSFTEMLNVIARKKFPRCQSCREPKGHAAWARPEQLVFGVLQQICDR